MNSELEETTGGNHCTKYLYDEAGNLTRVLYTDDGGSTWQTSDYQYDDVYALTKVTFPDTKTISYVYDKAGRRTRMVDPVLRYVREAQAGPRPANPTADAPGSIRQLIDANEATQIRREQSDCRGRRPHSYDYFAFGSVYGTPTEKVTCV